MRLTLSRIFVGALAGALALGPAASRGAPGAAAEPAPFAAPPGWYHGLWSDGTVMLVTAFSGALLLRRGGEYSASPRDLRLLGPVAGAGTGDRVVAAALGAEGSVLVWRDGGWHRGRAPTVGDDELRAVAVASDGSLYLAGARHALYVGRPDLTWEVFHYPAGLPGEVQVALWIPESPSESPAESPSESPTESSTKNTLLLLGDGGLALRFDVHDGALTPTDLFPREARDGRDHPQGNQNLRGAWASPSGDLWVISERELLRRRPSGELLRQRPPIFGRLSGISGISGISGSGISGISGSGAGDRVAIAGQSQLVIFDGATFSQVPGSYSFPEAIYLDGPGGIIYVAHRDGLRRIPLTFSGTLPEAFSRASSQASSRASSGVASDPPGPASRPASAPAGGDAAASETRSESPAKTKKTARRFHMPTSRVGFGLTVGRPAVTAGDAPPATAPLGAAFALDVLLGGTFGLRPKLALWPEVGYGHSRLPGGARHLFYVGAGPLVGGSWAAVGLLPRLALGAADGLFGVGARTGIVGAFAYDLLAVEVAHQWLRVDGRDLHEARILASVNLLPLLAVLTLGAAIANRRRR